MRIPSSSPRPRAERALALLLLAVALVAPAAAGAVTYAFDAPIAGDVVAVEVELVDAAGGDAVDVTVSIPPGEGDLLGLFGNVVTESLVSALGVDDAAGIVTQHQFKANQVWKVGGGNTMSPVKGWDWGVKLGATGSPGGVVVESASFRLTGPGLTVAELTGAANQTFVLGVRIQGTGGAEGSAKIGLVEGTPPVVEPPTLAIEAPAEGALLVASPVPVSGTVTGEGVSVDVNGTPAEVTSGTFGASLALADGVHTLTATVTNAAGTASDSVTITVDTTAPALAITAPADGTLTASSPVTVTGTVSDQTAVAEVDVNGVLVPVVAGAFTAEVPLAEGANTITASAADAGGHTGSASIAITLDTTPPAVAITSPFDGDATSLSVIPVAGTADDASGVTEVVVNGVVAALSGTTWSADIPLATGANPITATATDAAGNAGSAAITVTRGDPPTVAITAPADGALTSAAQITVTGEAPGAAAVDVNGVSAALSGGAFSATVALAEGANTLTATATNAFGQAQASVTVTRDSTPPVVTIDVPPDGAVYDSEPIGVFGSVADASPIVALTLNGSAIPAGTAFAETVSLALGANTITVAATDAAGNTGEASVTVTLADPEPLTVAITQPADGATTAQATLAVTGTVSAGADAVVVNGVAATLAGTSWSTSVPLASGSNLVEAVATRSGETATAAITVVRVSTPPPPPPADPVPTAVDPTVATDFAAATEFLYTGPDAVQTGVAAGTIEPLRAAVIRGRVLDRSGAPLPSVRVTVVDHPEYGETLSRADGAFDLVLNGGGRLRLRFERAGLIHAYRRVETAWRDYALLDDVVLVPRNGKVTVVDPASSAPFQAVESALRTDALGSRRVTLLYPQSTTASAVSGGAGQPLSTLSMRITEFTVGDHAVEAVPADLFPGTDPTVILDFSVDEAVALGADTVEFSQPVPFYLDNIHGTPVGSAAPIAFFDEELGAWAGEPAGIVLEIVDEDAGGVALLDADGDGDSDADDLPVLAAHGVTAAERAELGSRYEPGAVLRRYQTTHFSWGCAHLPPIFPPGAENPDNDEPRGGDGPDECDGSCPASVIRTERQVWAEAIDLVGTPFDLHYESDRTPGYVSAYSLDIPITDDTIPGPLLRVEVEVRVAGRRFRSTHPPLPDQTYRFTWDGQDAWGRRLQGRQPVVVRIGYVYSGISQGLRADLAKISQWRGEIGPWDARAAGLGGWTLSAHHAYDPYGKVLFRGDGRRRTGAELPQVVEYVAGGGTAFAPDGVPATEAALGGPRGLAVAPDGTIYVSGSENGFQTYRIFEIRPDGTFHRFAGSGGAGAAGDGGPALAAQLNNPKGLGVGPDGSVYIADYGNHRVRRVDPAGIITTFAGNGTFGFSGDGGPATSAQLFYPNDVEVAPDGRVYIADWGNGVVRVVMPDGTIRTVAGKAGNHPPLYEGTTPVPGTSVDITTPADLSIDGDGNVYIAGRSLVYRLDKAGQIARVAGDQASVSGAPLGDGGPALEANLWETVGVEAAPDGSLYLAQTTTHIVRRVTPDGLIRTVAGSGLATYVAPEGEGRPALTEKMQAPKQVAVHPDGGLLVVDQSRVKKVAPPLPGASVGDLIVPSDDGSELFVFDATGRHLMTKDALTGAILLAFAYTPEGTLDRITDADGNVTRVLRSASGAPIGIQPPFGPPTTLVTDANGFLASITNPASETHTITATAEGLITAFTKPGGASWSLDYDGDGRLIRDDDPEGGFFTLARDPASGTFTTTTAEGTTKSTILQPIASGGLSRVRFDTAGLPTLLDELPDGTTRTETPDGTVVTQVEGPDPRFGMQAPVDESLTIATPGGLVFQRTQSRTAAVDATTGLLQSQTDTLTVNGRTSTVDYTADPLKGGGTVVTTTAAGRLLEDTLDGLGRLTETQVDGLEAVRLGYDGAGRLQSLAQGTGAAERLVTFAYDADGNLASVTDPLSRTVSFAYDAAGRVTKQTLPDLREITFTYDSRGNLTSLTPPGQPAHVFRYSLLDQEEEYEPPAVDPGDPRTFFTYDRDRNLTRVDRPDGKAVVLGYDGAGRLATVTTPRGTTTQSYDPTTGNVSSLVAPGGEALAFGYDGSLVTSTTWSGTVNGTVSQTYDADFRVATQTVAGSTTETFAYDPDGLLIQAGAMTLGRDPLNGLLTSTAVGTVATSQGYNAFGELASDAAQVGAGTAYSNTYTRDELGRIVQKTETIQGATTTYTYHYDLAGRLEQVDENGSLARTYTYDANGNRLSVTDHTKGGVVTTGSYDAQDRLLSYGTFTYTYNGNGDLTSKTDTATGETTSYVYDALGNLVQVELPDGRTITYVIDGQNRRIGKKVDGTLVKAWLYQDQLNPVAELDGAGNVVARFVYGSRPNVPDLMIKGSVTYRILSDHLGSPRLVVDAFTGAVVQRLAYDEWGVVEYDTSPSFQPFGFAGGIYDPDTGLVRFGARDYAPEVGRWTAKDLIRFFGQDPNLYGYVRTNPTNLIDPSGLDALQDFLNCFKVNFGFAFGATNDFFFGGFTRVARTGVGAITGGAVARTTGGLTVVQAARAFARFGAGGLPTLGTTGTIAATAIGTATNAALSTVALEAGIVVGSAADALGQTLAGNCAPPGSGGGCGDHGGDDDAAE